jgi:tetratricopeptide (TPR) repeat protein
MNFMFLLLIRSILPLLLLATFLLPARAAETALLKGITRQDDLAGTLVRFEFTDTPSCRVVNSGHRVDLFFADTSVTPDLHLPPEDDRIVKVLTAHNKDGLMVSLLLRQMPAQVTTAAEKTSQAIRLEIFWEEGSGERPAIAFRISGLPTRQEHSAVAVPRQTSEFSGQWDKFFDRFESPFRIGASLSYSMPELPPFERGIFPRDRSDLLDMASSRDWAAVSRALDVSSDPDQPQHSLPPPLRLLRAEALLRTGRAPLALEILDGFLPGALPPGLNARTCYLHSLSLAMCGDSFRAQTRLSEIASALETDRFRPYCRLLKSELALAGEDFGQALEVLDAMETEWPAALRTLRTLRRADALVGLQREKEALGSYRVLLEKNIWPENKPFSLSQGAKAFFRDQDWQQAGKLYRRLANSLPMTPVAGQAFFGAALAAYRSGNTDAALQSLRLIRENFPGTESAYRAWLKLLDHGVLDRREGGMLEAIRGYDAIAAQAANRDLREEAAFKLGLVLYLHGEETRAVETMDNFRRDFAGGPLRSQADALLTEILPPLIETLVADGRDLEAVTLVEKNRELLINQHTNWPFLPELARAFTRLGLFERGCKVYLYLLEKTENRPEAGRFYLPLVALYFDLEEYALVEKFSQRYLVKYPDGNDRKALFLLRLKALEKSGGTEQAAKLLRERNRPADNDIELEATRIFWQIGDYSQVIACANRLGENGEPVPPEGLLLEAEAMRRLGRARNALPLYQVLAEDGTFGDQAAYRCGEILLDDGRRAEALKIWRKLAEKGDNPLWRTMAGDALDAARF